MRIIKLDNLKNKIEKKENIKIFLEKSKTCAGIYVNISNNKESLTLKFPNLFAVYLEMLHKLS